MYSQCNYMSVTSRQASDISLRLLAKFGIRFEMCRTAIVHKCCDIGVLESSGQLIFSVQNHKGHFGRDSSLS